MIINLTLCDKILKGDIPEYELYSIDETIGMIEYWVETRKKEETVMVAFLNFREQDYKNEQIGIFVGHSLMHLLLFSKTTLDFMSAYGTDISLDYSIFEFESYEEAFKYCIDLREGL